MSVGECRSLRLVFCSGEALPAATVRKTYACLPHIELHNLYGPTEAAVDVTAWACPRELTGDRVSIGRPVANTQMYVLDGQGQPTPMGVSGELYIGGIQVARGYLNQPELSAERFLPDPFSPDPAARMYRTGDVGCWLEDGSLEYQGRNDDQVKIRGFRIELGEITSVLQRCSGIQEAIVVARVIPVAHREPDKQAPDKQAPDKQAPDKQLVAYYTPTADAAVNIDIDAVKAVLLDLLPEHMVPAAYVQLETMPLTPNGKIDRKALPEPDEGAFVRQVYEAPQTPLEILLADIWQRLLNVTQVGRHDNFFELGGHSLLAVQLIERLRQQGYTLPVKTLFEHPSLATLALTLSETAGRPVFKVPENKIPAHCTHITPAMLPLVTLTDGQIRTVTSHVAGGAANVQDIYPLAPLQEGILYHHLLAEHGDPYLNSVILPFTGEAEATAFVDAIQFVIQRHDILRTAIQWEGLDEPVQVVWREATLPVTTLVIDSEDVAGELQRRFAPTHARIEITQAPLMAVYLAADPAHDRWLLCLLNHHLNSDHTTLELLMNEVQAYLAGQAGQLPAPLPFRNFVAQARMGVDLAAQQAYFTAQLGDIDTPSAPYELLDVQGDGGQIARTQLSIETTLATRLASACETLRCQYRQFVPSGVGDGGSCHDRAG
ncbi:AMP-binding protein [Vibrio sp. PP-XX7]